jgi:hypothetical protein
VVDAVGHQLTHHQPDVFELLRRQDIRQLVQGMARGRDDLGLGGQSQIDLSYYQKAPVDRPALQALCTLGHVSLHVAWLCSGPIGENRGVYAKLVTIIDNC